MGETYHMPSAKTGWLVKDWEFYRLILFVAMPAAFQQTINIGVNLMDTIMVGALGEAALSASSLANQYYNLYFILCYGISGGSCVLSAQYWGAGNRRMVKQVWRLAMYISAGAAMVFALVTFLFPAPIMSVYTDHGEIIALGARYLKWTSLVFFFHGTSLIMVNLLRTAGSVRVGLMVSGISFAVNIFFNYVFIFGKCGMPRMGIAGAAVGTLISRITEFTITFLYLFLFERHVRFLPGDLFGRPDRELLKTFGKTGFPVIVSDGMYTIGDNVLSMILGHMGPAVISGQAITLNTMRICTVFIMGLSQASSVIIGQTAGSGQWKETLLKGKTFYLLSVFAGLIGGGIIWLASPFIVSLYHLSPASAAVTMEMMAAMSLLMVFQSVQSVMSKGVLRGGGDTVFLVFADLVFLWLLNIPLGYCAGLLWGWRPFWVFVCLKLDAIGKTLLCLWRLVGGKWIKNIT